MAEKAGGNGKGSSDAVEDGLAKEKPLGKEEEKEKMRRPGRPKKEDKDKKKEEKQEALIMKNFLAKGSDGFGRRNHKGKGARANAGKEESKCGG